MVEQHAQAFRRELVGAAAGLEGAGEIRKVDGLVHGTVLLVYRLVSTSGDVPGARWTVSSQKHHVKGVGELFLQRWKNSSGV